MPLGRVRQNYNYSRLRSARRDGVSDSKPYKYIYRYKHGAVIIRAVITVLARVRLEAIVFTAKLMKTETSLGEGTGKGAQKNLVW